MMNLFVRSGYILAVIIGVLISPIIGEKSQQAYAASQDECAIWLCLPGGFPTGCAAAHTAMIKRIKKLKPPLPAFGSCASGESGNYKMGVEYYEPCKEGFTFFKPENYGGNSKAICINLTNKCLKFKEGIGGYYPPELDCTTYNPIKRPKPHYVEMWVNGDYLGKHFYQ